MIHFLLLPLSLLQYVLIPHILNVSPTLYLFLARVFSFPFIIRLAHY